MNTKVHIKLHFLFLNENHSYQYFYNYFRFIRNLRVSTVDNTFISANLWAEMKKAYTYKIDIKIRDSTIEEAQCECGAGQGPTAHCKHVATTLYAICVFHRKGDITTEVTCTQVCST